jgi:ketosteroid isomerase-like protein
MKIIKRVASLITILFLGITMSSFAQSKEEEAIKAVCEKETQSFNNRDADAMISCHANKPYSLMLVAESGNVHYTTAKSAADSEKSIKDLMAMMGPPNGDLFSNSGYVIHINGTSAFTYYDQMVTAKDGTKTNFHEVRNLEKMDGKWKIIYVGAIGFKQDEK